MSTFVFLHAHPDDEAIFTGGTIARLADAGHRVVVAYATSGELGHDADATLGARRRAEAMDACAILGVARVVFLDHRDSGVAREVRDRPWGAFADVPAELVADHLADIVDGERAAAVVSYDADGVYGHPDHIHAHDVVALAAGRLGLPTWYEVTVDREYLHFVDTHVAHLASAALLERGPLGRTTVEIDLTVDVRSTLGPKLGAIAAHHSQVDGDPTFGSADQFPAVYGYEWFIRHGAVTALDGLALRPLDHRTESGATR